MNSNFNSLAKIGLPALAVILFLGAFAIYEDGNYRDLRTQNDLMAAQLTQTRAEMRALSAQVQVLAVSKQAQDARNSQGGAETRQTGATSDGEDAMTSRKNQAKARQTGKAIKREHAEVDSDTSSAAGTRPLTRMDLSSAEMNRP